ncbi:MAG: type I 3-dehydroquinate dehydratase [Candidatus Hodarchaeota archaeon]
MYNICISIPIKNDNFIEIKTLVDKALTFNPAFIEFRFDYINKLEYLTEKFVRQIKDLIENQAYCIFTLRHDSEGGRNKIEKSHRIEKLEVLIGSQPDFLDIEMNSDLDTLRCIINLSYMKKVNLIFSYHNLEETPDYEIVKEIILRFEETVIKNRMNEFDILGKSVYKLIFTAQNFEDNITPLKLCQDLSRNNKKVISFCMDYLGILSRLMCVKLGSFLTYATLEEQTAPGQIYVKTMQELYELISNE